MKKWRYFLLVCLAGLVAALVLAELTVKILGTWSVDGITRLYLALWLLTLRPSWKHAKKEFPDPTKAPVSE